MLRSNCTLLELKPVMELLLGGSNLFELHLTGIETTKRLFFFEMSLLFELHLTGIETMLTRLEKVLSDMFELHLTGIETLICSPAYLTEKYVRIAPYWN